MKSCSLCVNIEKYAMHIYAIYFEKLLANQVHSLHTLTRYGFMNATAALLHWDKSAMLQGPKLVMDRWYIEKATSGVIQ